MMKELKKDKGWFYLFIILTITVLINNIYLIINIAGLHDIENALRLTVCIIIGILSLLDIFLVIKALLKRKTIFYIILILLTLIGSGIVGFININFNIIYKKLNKITVNYTTYSISLVTTSDNTVDSIDKIGNDNIAIINDREIANGYNFGAEIIKSKKMNNTLVEYEGYIEILNDLLDKKIKYAFLPSNYREAFSSIEGYENIYTDLKVIYEQNKQEEQVVSTKSVTEPFTLLLMGVDSTNDSIAGSTANGDTLMLITFNPNTLKATMVSIPRDSYVPITCMGNRKNKINHSSWGGEKCIIKTVEQFMDTKIDYYAKINFTGIVKLVDNLGGINVDVEYSFCEQDSKRRLGPNLVYVKKGLQTLSGEQALAYSRNRHPNPEWCPGEWSNYDSNDFVRGQHQQDIVKGILSKLKDIKDLDTFYSILDTVSDNMETNMDKNTILSFYNVAKDIVIKSKGADSVDELINIQRLYISGISAMVYDYNQNINSGSGLILYQFVPSKDSVNAVIKEMKINLGEQGKDPIYTFNYDVNSPYEQKIIGKNIYSNANIELLPDLTGQTKAYVENYATTHNLKLTLVEEESDKPAGTVIAQDPPAKMDLENMSASKGLTITLAIGKANSSSNTKYNICKDEENKENSICQLKIDDYIGRNYTAIKSLRIDNSIAVINFKPVTEGATRENTGTIKAMNDEVSGIIYLTDEDLVINVEYYSYVNNGNEDSSEDESSSGGSQTPSEDSTPSTTESE